MKIVEFKDYDNQTTPLSAYNLNRLQQNLITTKYQMTFSSAVSGGSTITLPCYYQVGQDTLDVYLNSELLKKASTKDSEGHYYEVGNSDTKSNQIKITSDWSIASGDVLNLIVRGTTDSYDQNLSPDKATQLADEISANKEEITALQTENSRLIRPKVANQQKVIDQLPQVTGQGTSITLENTIEAQFTKFDIEGNSEQETSTQGKNYFTGNKIDGGTNLGVTYSFDNSILRLNGTSTGGGTVLGDISTKVVLPAGNYKFRASLYSGSFEKNSKDIAIYLRSKDEYISGNLVTSGITLSTLNNITAFTLTESTELYLRIYVNGDGLVFNNTQLAILLVKVENDEDIGTFEQFVPNMPSPDYPSEVECCGDNGSINEVICNKNFANVDVEQGAISAYEGRDYAFTKVNSNTRIRTKDLIKLDTSKTYTINFNKKYNVVIQAFNSNKLLYSVSDGIANIWHTNSFNFSGYPYVAVAIRNNDNTSNITPSEIEKVKLSLSETDKTQTYTIPTQQPMRSIGDVRDTFIKKNNKWYERHNINRRIFDGTTNKFVKTSGTANNLFVTNTFEDGNIIVPSTYGENVQHFNNYFQTNYPSNGLYANGQYVGSAIRPTDDMVMGFGKKSEINTVDKANAWLKAKYDAGAPLYVDYILEEPLDLPCTPEQIQQLENRPSTYKDFTIIQSQDETEAYLEVSGIYDLNNLINNFIRKEI